MRIKRKFKGIVLSLVLTAYMTLLVVYARQVSADMRMALSRCLNVIIPSLFDFMAVSNLFIRSGVYIYISRLFYPLAKLVRLPCELIFVFVIANTAGYPLGAVLISQLFDEGSLDKKSASRLLCSCYNGGPAFFSGAVGLAVYSSAKTGLIVYLSILLANIFAAAVLNRIFPITFKKNRCSIRFRIEMITDSVCEAGISLFKICAMILFFSTVITVVSVSNIFIGLSENVRALAGAFVEISNLSSISGSPFRLLPFVASAGAFGGICVIMQVKVACKDRFSLVPFILARLFCAAAAGGFCILLNRFFGVKEVSAAVQTDFIVNLNNFLPSICLIMMIFLTIARKRLAFYKEM